MRDARPGVLLAIAVASAAWAAEEAPSLTVASAHPVVVEGRGFAADEPVTLRTSINGEQFEKKVNADAKGCFTAQIADVDAECVPFRVSAEGERGSRAVTPQRVPPPCGVPIPP
jgi:hypothetical protein